MVVRDPRSSDESPKEIVAMEVRLLLEAVFLRYSYDFRQYSQASMYRRVHAAMTAMGASTISALQERILRDSQAFNHLLQFLTVPVSEMFRDPGYFRGIRESVVPYLRTYPSLKLWVAGCSTGEEVYSFAILLAEENLLDRTLIYATDINPTSLRRAQEAVYSAEEVRKHSLNYQRSGGLRSLSDYYTAAYGAVSFSKSLRENVVFSDHSLATDSVFSEVQLVSCRNVLIYFDKGLQNRAVSLFRDSLCRDGFLGIGSKESLKFTESAERFEPWGEPSHRIYRKKARL